MKIVPYETDTNCINKQNIVLCCRLKNYNLIYNFTIRQNFFKKTPKAHDIVKSRKRLIMPFGHYFDKSLNNGKNILKKNRFNETKIGSIGRVLEAKEQNSNRIQKILLVKIISERKSEVCDDLFVILNKKDSECNKHTDITEDCTDCIKNIKKIRMGNYDELCREYKSENVKTLSVYYKDIEILDELDICTNEFGKCKPNHISSQSMVALKPDIELKKCESCGKCRYKN
jgi:hypothetical protein